MIFRWIEKAKTKEFEPLLGSLDKLILSTCQSTMAAKSRHEIFSAVQIYIKFAEDYRNSSLCRNFSKINRISNILVQ